MRGWTGSVVTRTCEGLVTRLPAEAADALVVDTVFLVMSCMVAGEAEWFFRCNVAEGEMVEFLEERESIKAMEGVYKVGFLFVYDGVCGSEGCNSGALKWSPDIVSRSAKWCEMEVRDGAIRRRVSEV